jgi:2-polyprenyl-6-hydroxyphenyl methylase/3-demethylubiquinone-9 3-methyltransferase
MSEKTHKEELASGERFAFGDNWRQFLALLTDDRINEAVKSLQSMLGETSLEGKSFLDIGNGSGLFSLAAKKLGARVHSFDYDPQSVACALELKRRYFESDPSWTIETGSVLDQGYLNSLGRFDVVYSWGVLHHTGNMWQALENVSDNVADEGKLFISLYNNQGGASRRWTLIKRVYNRLPQLLKLPFALFVYFPVELKSFLIQLLRGKPHHYFEYIRNYNQNRGMNWWRDKIDWIGGYPFEVSTPDEIFDFYHTKGYELIQLKTCMCGFGCNEFVFKKKPETH